jgi:hypothetical protein
MEEYSALVDPGVKNQEQMPQLEFQLPVIWCLMFVWYSVNVFVLARIYSKIQAERWKVDGKQTQSGAAITKCMSHLILIAL